MYCGPQNMNSGCDTMIYSKKYISRLHPSFWHKAPETLRSNQVVFCYVNKVNFRTHLRMGAGCQDNQMCDEKVETFLAAFCLQGEDRGWRLSLITSGVSCWSENCLVLCGNTLMQTHTGTHWNLVQGPKKNSAQERHFKKEFCLEWKALSNESDRILHNFQFYKIAKGRCISQGFSEQED